MERRFEQALVRLLEKIHEIHFFKREISKKKHVVGRETDKDSNDYQTGLCMARSVDEIGKVTRKIKKNEQKNNQNLTMLED